MNVILCSYQQIIHQKHVTYHSLIKIYQFLVFDTVLEHNHEPQLYNYIFCYNVVAGLDKLPSFSSTLR